MQKAHGILWDFWYVIEHIFLRQKLLKPFVLQLVKGWPFFSHKIDSTNTSTNDIHYKLCSDHYYTVLQQTIHYI